MARMGSATRRERPTRSGRRSSAAPRCTGRRWRGSGPSYRLQRQSAGSPGRRPLRDLAERRSRCLANDQRHRRRGEHPHQVRRHFGLYPLQGRDDRGSALHRLDQHLGLQREGETRRHPRFGQPFRKPSAKLVNAIPAPDKTASDRPGLTQLDDEWGRRDRAVMRGRCATTCAAPCAASGPGCAAPCAASGPGSWGGLLQGPAHPRFIGFLRTWAGAGGFTDKFL
jgi:hypothetical protein